MTMLLALFVINRSHGLVARADDPETTEASISADDPETTEASIRIEWDDNNDQDGMRPASVSADLLADGNFRSSILLDSANEWQQTVSGLSVSENSNYISYSWNIDNIQGYKKEIISGDNEKPVIFKLKHSVETTSASVSINWIDDNNRRGARPESVSVNLFANGEKCDSVVLNAGNDWKAAKADLDKKTAGNDIVYSWETDAGRIPGEYHESAREINGTATTISLTMVPEKGSLKLLAAEKDNDSIKLSGAKVKLYSDIAPSASAASVTKNGKKCYELMNDGYTSDSNGIIRIDDLEYGKYYIECLTAPSGYHLPDNVWSEINVSGTTGKQTDPDCKLYYVKESTSTTITDADVVLPAYIYTYTGKAIEPVPIVTVNGVLLSDYSDYTVTYLNNIDAGVASVMIEGKGRYQGIVLEVFTIEPYKITSKSGSDYTVKVTFSRVKYEYSGSACEPEATVKQGSKTLKKGTDYTVEYENNTQPRTDTNVPTVIVKGKGNYTGTRKFSFTITKSIKDAKITFSKGDTVEYTGGRITNEISSVKLDDVTLKSGTDYEIADASTLSGTAAGSYTVKINGKGYYSGSVQSKWTIKKTNTTQTTSPSTSTTTSGTNTNSSNSGSDYVSSTTKRSSSSSTKPSGITTGSNTSKTASGNSVSGNKTGKATTGGSSSSSAGGRSVSGNAAGRDAADTVESTGSVSDDSVSANTFPDGEIKKESYGNSGGLKKFTYDGSRNGVIENILTPAPGYENDPPVTGAVDDIAAVGEALMAGDFKEAVEDGAELEVWVDVQPAEDTVSEEEKSLAEKYIMSITDKVAGLCIGRYLDVNVFFRVDRGVWEEVEKTNVPIAVDFSAPDSMKAQSDRFYVLCIHDGKVELLSDINSDPDMITVMTQWLQATYVLLYQDVDAAAAGEIYGPSQASFYTEHDSFDFTAKAADKPKHTPPKFLAISWFMSSFLVLGGYGIYEALKDKEAFKAMLDSLPKRRQTSKTA